MPESVFRPEVHIQETPDALVEHAATWIAADIEAQIQANGRCALLLSGGSTPRALYARLAQPDLSKRIDWRRVYFFWGDERCVPPEHADSNYRLAAAELFARLPMDGLNIQRISAEAGAHRAAELYERTIMDIFADWGLATPVFDLVLLGVGEDGHTASIFPGTPAETEMQRWVVGVTHNQPPPPLVDRVSVTLRLINTARQVLFLVTGASKRQVVAAALAGGQARLPVQRVQPESGQVVWMLDRAAAGL